MNQSMQQYGGSNDKEAAGANGAAPSNPSSFQNITLSGELAPNDSMNQAASGSQPRQSVLMKAASSLNNNSSGSADANKQPNLEEFQIYNEYVRRSKYSK